MECKTCKHKWNEIIEKSVSINENIDSFLEAFEINQLEKLIRNDLRSYPSSLLRIGACGSPNL